MKITDVECLILDRSFPFVRVFTDEGVVGIGECFRRQPAIIKALIDELLKPALVGRDPIDTTVGSTICSGPPMGWKWAAPSGAPSRGLT